ncbi:MAG: TRAP transporter substrate-binding protein DctP [Candidatus Krumholzibacteria bacterium]|nr:TRAP transporter substrate-binding protein DctP [Candidatus Krumholzibacteria bacterium]
MTCSERTARRARLLAAGVLAAALVAPSADAHAGKRPDKQIKFATLAPDGSTWMKTMRAIDGEVRRRTEGRLGFKFYPGGVQGDEKDVLRKIRIGQLHGGGFTGNGLGSIVSETRVLELPFLFEDLEELDHVREALAGYFDSAFDEQGYVLLGWTDVGFIYILSQEPIHGPEDMNRQKMWVWSGDPLAEMFFKAFDISPIPISAPDVLTSLQTGVIEAVYSSPLACVALQWYTRVRYMTDVPLTHGLGAAVVTRKALEGVSDADVQILRDVAAPQLRRLSLKTREQNVEALSEIQKEGVEIVTVEKAVRDEFFRRGRAAWSDGVGTLYSQELLDRVRALLAAYRGNP